MGRITITRSCSCIISLGYIIFRKKTDAARIQEEASDKRRRILEHNHPYILDYDFSL